MSFAHRTQKLKTHFPGGLERAFFSVPREMAEENQCTKDHLFVLTHGLQMVPGAGTSSMYYLANALRESLPDSVIYIAKSNVGLNTLDGIDSGGKRLASEIQSFVSESKDLKKISFVGYSLGGLHARYAVGVLFDTTKNLIAGLEPLNFVTMGSPHLGNRNLLPLGSLAHSVTSLLLGSTGKQLVLLDSKTPESGVLHDLTLDSSLPFISALKSFRHRLLYANTCADFQVPPKIGCRLRVARVQYLKHPLRADRSSTRPPPSLFISTAMSRRRSRLTPPPSPTSSATRRPTSASFPRRPARLLLATFLLATASAAASIFSPKDRR